MLLEVKVIFKRATLGFKIHFLSISFQSSKPTSLKNRYLTKQNVTGGRGVKKCHVLFEWPHVLHVHYVTSQLIDVFKVKLLIYLICCSCRQRR